MTLPTIPTLAGFTDFVRNVVGVPTSALPVDSPWIEFSYDLALEIVNLQLCRASPEMYVQAVYNLGADDLFNFAQDVTPLTPFETPGNNDQLPYFAYFRSTWKMNDFVAGVVQSTSDEGTSVTLLVQDAAMQFKLADLQNLKTPWGRNYLAIAQRVGTLWGLS